MQTHKQMHLRSLNLTLICQSSKGYEWEGVCSAQEDVRISKCPRAIPKSRPPSIYKSPKPKRAIGHSLQRNQGHRTHRCTTIGRIPASDDFLARRITAMCPIQTSAVRSSTVTKVARAAKHHIERSIVSHRTLNVQCLMQYREVPETHFEHRTRQVGVHRMRPVSDAHNYIPPCRRHSQLTLMSCVRSKSTGRTDAKPWHACRRTTHRTLRPMSDASVDSV
jgi:hypothetical protein